MKIFGDQPADFIRRRVRVLAPQPAPQHVDSDVVHREHGTKALGDVFRALVVVRGWSHARCMIRIHASIG